MTWRVLSMCVLALGTLSACSGPEQHGEGWSIAWDYPDDEMTGVVFRICIGTGEDCRILQARRDRVNHYRAEITDREYNLRDRLEIRACYVTAEGYSCTPGEQPALIDTGKSTVP